MRVRKYLRGSAMTLTRRCETISFTLFSAEFCSLRQSMEPPLIFTVLFTLTAPGISHPHSRYHSHSARSHPLHPVAVCWHYLDLSSLLLTLFCSYRVLVVAPTLLVHFFTLHLFPFEASDFTIRDNKLRHLLTQLHRFITVSQKSGVTSHQANLYPQHVVSIFGVILRRRIFLQRRSSGAFFTSASFTSDRTVESTSLRVLAQHPEALFRLSLKWLSAISQYATL